MKHDHTKHHPRKQNEDREAKSTRASFHHGTTTQGGSDFGQGSYQLGKDANRQGSEENSGSNYGNEKRWNNEALRKEDMKQQAPSLTRPRQPVRRSSDL